MSRSTREPTGHRIDASVHVLREYSLVADGRRGAVIGPRGDIAWLCVPDWDSEPVFSTLIAGEGTYAVTPTDTPFVWGGYYDANTLIWNDRWTTTHQFVECREALAYPGDEHRTVVLRRVRAVDGAAQVSVTLDARAGFGQAVASDVHVDDRGTWTARVGPIRMRWSGAGQGVRLDNDGALHTIVDVPDGGHHDLVLELSDQPLPRNLPDPRMLWEQTERAWRAAVPEITGTMADGDASHAYAVLRGLTTPGAGMVAAATMSLPERAEAGRNYDYRYAWIRDQAYAGVGVASLGPHPLLDDATHFITERLLSDGAKLAPAYTVRGGPIPDEQRIDLPGYPGGADIVGNKVGHQLQLDAFGESLILLAAAAQHDHLERDGWAAVEVAARAVADRWPEADAGIWELDDHRWAHSRLSCVAGLRAVARHAPRQQSATWSALADRILTSVRADCTHSSGRWQRAPDDARVDAALLLPAVRGAVPLSDPRSEATLMAVLDELADDYYLYRFRQDDGPLADAEGAFLLCGFIAALAEHQQGRMVEAARWFERNRASCGPPGLLAEEYDVVQRQIRGNLPQAFVHALLLESAVVLAADPPA
ncbi:glycoside hydrolase family 15 protein [Intrasporangium mesophilum]